MTHRARASLLLSLALALAGPSSAQESLPPEVEAKVTGTVRSTQGVPLTQVDVYYAVINADQNPYATGLLDEVESFPWRFGSSVSPDGRFAFSAQGVRLFPDDAEIVDQLSDCLFMLREPPFTTRILLRVKAKRGWHEQLGETSVSVHAPDAPPADLVVLRKAEARGRVVDANGHGVPGVRLACSSEALPSGELEAWTDHEGHYTLDGAEGACTLSVVSPLWVGTEPQAVTLVPEHPNALGPLEVVRRTAIVVHVPGYTDGPSLSVVLEAADGTTEEGIAWAHQGDTYVWSGAPAGTWSATVMLQQGRLERFDAGELVVAEGAHTELGGDWARSFLLDNALCDLRFPRLFQRPDQRARFGAEALERCRAALASDPDDADALALAGLAYTYLLGPEAALEVFGRGDDSFGRAEASFERACELGHPAALVRRAVARAANGQVAKALADLDRALAGPGTPSEVALKVRAKLRWEQGLEREATADLRRSRELWSHYWEVSQGNKPWDPAVRGEQLLAELFPDYALPEELESRSYQEPE